MNTETNAVQDDKLDGYFDEGARLAAATSAAIAWQTKVNNMHFPVPTSIRTEAADAVVAAQRAEAAYWEGIAQNARDKAAQEREERVTTMLAILDVHNANVDFEPGYRVIYGAFTKISEARAALLAVREVAPAATMVVDGTKATITIAMGGEG